MSHMTDLEITRLCAEAMGVKFKILRAISNSECFNEDSLLLTEGHPYPHAYNPLHDDAQAMALVKKMKLDVNVYPLTGGWEVSGNLGNAILPIVDSNLNRAICECVAKMQSSK